MSTATTVMTTIVIIAVAVIAVVMTMETRMAAFRRDHATSSAAVTLTG